MPRCFVERCHNYGGKRLNIILHSFPNNLDKIKTWLRCIERSGHVIRDMEELAERIFEGKTNNRFRVCSEHFTEQSYQPSGLRKTLRKDAVPTIFRDVPPQKCPWQKVKPALKSAHADLSPSREQNRGSLTLHPPHRQSVFDTLPNHRGGRTNMETMKATEHFQQKNKDGHSLGRKPTDVPHVILKLTLEILCLLTGEDYIVVKKMSGLNEGWSRTQSAIIEPPPDSSIQVKNKRKIIELTNKIMELLSGEECGCVEDHRKDIQMERHQPLASLDDMVNGLSDPTPAHVTEELSCEEKEDVHIPDDYRQRYLFTNIKVEAVSYDGGHLTKPSTPISTDDHQPSTPIKEEAVSCDEGNVIDPTQQHVSPKEEAVESGNLTDPNVYPPKDYTQYTSVIKEEPVPYEGGDLTGPDMYTPENHVHRMEEPSSCDGGNIPNPIDPSEQGRAMNPDTSTEAEQASSHTEGEKEEAHNNYSMFDKGNLDTDIYALIKHAQAKYTFTRIEDGSSSEEEENSNDTDLHVPADHTPQRPPNGTGEAAPQTFQCPDCSECFTRKSGLINHRRNHRQEKLTCSKCGKVFSKRSSLQNHLTLHTGEKPFACPICGKCFARKSNLISHETIHSGKASFICAECGRYFVCKVHLTKHQIIHEK